MYTFFYYIKKVGFEAIHYMLHIIIHNYKNVGQKSSLATTTTSTSQLSSLLQLL